MEAEELLEYLKDCMEEFELTPTMYDRDKMQYKVTVGILEPYKDGVIKRFTITVDDHLPRQY